MKLFSTLATVMALATSTSLAAAPFCDALADVDQLPKKYAKRGPFHADATSGWVIGSDQLKASFDVTAETQALWSALHRAFADRGVELVVLAAPPRPLFAPESALPAGADLSALQSGFSDYVAALNAAGIAAPDLSDAAEGEMAQAFYFARDTHWTPKGAAWSAVKLAEMMGRNPAPLADVAFTQSYTEKGSLSTVVEKVCGTRPEVETRPAPQFAQAGGAAALLGDAPEATVALVGTSFSDRYQTDAYQVAGALSYALGAEVQNFSVTGGGLVGAMSGFLESGALASQQFDTVVWETPYTNPLTQIAGLRQILGALEAEGTKADVYAGAITSDWQAVDVSDVSLVGGSLRIETPGVSEGQLTVELWSADKTKLRYKLRKSDRLDADARSDIWHLSLTSLPVTDVSRVKFKLNNEVMDAKIALIN